VRRLTTQTTILQAALDSLLGSIYVSMPGVVTAYNPATQTATVQPLLNDVRYDVITGQPYPEPWPVLQGVKVMWPTAGGCTMAGTLQANDSVNLICYDFDPSNIAKPGAQTVTPTNVRKLGGSFWRAIPEGIYGPGLTAASDRTSDGCMFVGVDGGQAQLRFNPKTGTIQLGAAAVMPVALAPPLVTALAAIATYTASLTTAAAAGAAAPDPTGVAFQTFATALQGLGAAIASALATAQTATPAKIVRGQ
jgi:hypothetical protein